MNLIKEVNNMLRIPEVARFLGYEPNRSGFIKSPFSQEKTASCKLYNDPGKGFCDFSTGTAGDCIKFVSMTQRVDNWTAAKMMVEAFSLPVNMNNTHLTKNKVQELKRQREADQKRKVVNKKKWIAEMDSLESTIRTCEDILINPHIEPMSELWCMAVERRNKAVIQANEMCGIETRREDLRLPKRNEKEREVS